MFYNVCTKQGNNSNVCWAWKGMKIKLKQSDISVEQSKAKYDKFE